MREIFKWAYQEMDMTEIEYRKLKYFEKGCKRRLLFDMLKDKGIIKGISQYYSVKKIYTMTKIFDYIVNKFSTKSLDDFPYEVGGKFDTRLENEDVSELISNLESLMIEHEISFESVNIPMTYEYNDTKITLHCDAKGTIGGDLALFKLNLTTRFSREDAYELVCINDVATKSDGEYYRLVVLKLGSAQIREVIERGDRTKKDVLKKNGIPEWTTLLNELNEQIVGASDVLSGLKTSPEAYDVPTFGSCGICPYHNVKITYNGKTTICVG